MYLPPPVARKGIHKILKGTRITKMMMKALCLIVNEYCKSLNQMKDTSEFCNSIPSNINRNIFKGQKVEITGYIFCSTHCNDFKDLEFLLIQEIVLVNLINSLKERKTGERISSLIHLFEIVFELPEFQKIVWTPEKYCNHVRKLEKFKNDLSFKI